MDLPPSELKPTRGKRIRRHLTFIIMTAVVLGIWTFLLFVGVDTLIESVGASNGYIVMFLIALFGGVSSFTSTSYYASVVAFAIAGLDPIILAFVSSAGLTVGDTLFFYLGTKGRDMTKGKLARFLSRVKRFVRRQPRWAIPIITYLYTGFSPFPGDILMVALGVSGAKYKQIIVPTFLGNATLAFILAYLGLKGITIFAGGHF